MTTYDDIICYLNDNTDFQDKITRYNNIIDALELQLLSNAAGQEHDYYELDDGQTRIKSVIKDFSKIERTITAVERLKQRCINQNIGRISRLERAIDIKTRNGII